MTQQYNPQQEHNSQPSYPQPGYPQGGYPQGYQYQPPMPRKKSHKVRNTFLGIGGGLIAIIVISVAASGGSGGGSSSVPASGSSATVQQPSKAPSPAAPAPGNVIAKYHGSGSDTTPHFKVPSNGVYDVSWSYYGNVDNSLGESMPDNFNIENTGDGDGMDLPNDVKTSGSGSTEVTDGDGTDSFNVQANSAAHWTITIKTAS